MFTLGDSLCLHSALLQREVYRRTASHTTDMHWAPLVETGVGRGGQASGMLTAPELAGEQRSPLKNRGKEGLHSLPMAVHCLAQGWEYKAGGLAIEEPPPHTPLPYACLEMEGSSVMDPR